VLQFPSSRNSKNGRSGKHSITKSSRS